VISTQALLFAVGVGAGSIPLAAALNWIIKDGLGQLGGVLYATFANNRFDRYHGSLWSLIRQTGSSPSEPKHHRFYSHISLQLSTLLEVITPLFPHAFLLLASISNIGEHLPSSRQSCFLIQGKNISWIAGSATRAQIHYSLTLRDNLGDITGKATSQSIAGSLLGLHLY
jgi:hypothetical protein